jgi:hypothetical protein
MKKYWIVNDSYPDAVTAVEKIVEAETKDLPYIILTDLEYITISNPQAMLVIQRSED